MYLSIYHIIHMINRYKKQKPTETYKSTHIHPDIGMCCIQTHSFLNKKKQEKKLKKKERKQKETKYYIIWLM